MFFTVILVIGIDIKDTTRWLSDRTEIYLVFYSHISCTPSESSALDSHQPKNNMPVEHIRGNLITDLRLVNPPEHHFRGNPASVFADAFSENTSIKYVRFDRDFFPGLSPEDRKVLIGKIGKLRNLEELQLWNGAIQASVLATALQDCP